VRAKVYPVFDGIRDDPRFKALVARLKMTNMTAARDRVNRCFSPPRTEPTRPAFLDAACGDDQPAAEVRVAPARTKRRAASRSRRPLTLAGRPLQRGDRLGPYEIVELLGAGGMGEVYRARDSKLGRDVAIKVLPLFIANADRLARFEREGGMLASLNHPHLLTVHDVGNVDGRPYLITEFVDGGTLKTWALAEKRTWRQAVELLAGVATAAVAARASYRDVSRTTS
jgi:hypothetical protein